MEPADSNLIDLAIDAANNIAETLGTDHPSRLPKPFCVVLLASWAQSHIDNGGLAFFYEMDAPGCPSYEAFEAAYRDIGAFAAANAIKKSSDLFPSSEPHLDSNLRRAHMFQDRLDIQPSFDKLDRQIFGDNVWDKLVEYIKANWSLFFH